MARKSRPMGREHISPSLDRHLNQYALMAAVAGVGLASLSVPSDAEIIYSPAYKTAKGTQFGATILIDFNHDGTQDAEILARTFLQSAFSRPPASIDIFYGFLSAIGDNQNEVLLKNGLVEAVPAGKVIGPGQPFGAGVQKMAYCIFGTDQFTGSTIASSSYGSWTKVNNRYIGFKFFIQGQAHFGWARFNTLDKLRNCGEVGAALTGYAYETEPNKSIVAGDTGQSADAAAAADAETSLPTEPVVPTQPRRRTLGRLAAGAVQ